MIASLPMQGLLARIAPLAIAVVAAGLTHWFAYSRGAAHTATAYELKLQRFRTASATARAELERRAREAERDAAAMLAAQSELHAQEAHHAQMEIDSLRDDLRDKRVRLSVPVASCSAGSEAAADPAASRRPGAEARAELVPETAAELVGIAADGDAAVRQSNRLIDAYNQLRELYNAQACGAS